MRPIYWCFALATFATTLAAAQQQSVPSGSNPLSRGENTTFFRAFPSGPLDSPRSAIARPTVHVGPVTPVPEPSEWLMMAAGLGVVGFIVRRGARRS